MEPSTVPSDSPSSVPSDVPSDQPSSIPSDIPSDLPSDVPSDQPSSIPSSLPSDIPSVVPSDVPSALDLEKNALIALFDSTKGDSWSVSWDTTEPVCDWHGVECVDGLISGLKLEFNNLQGTIPTEIGDLSNLQIINLKGNNLSGNIPTEIGRLSSLQELYLEYNFLSGEMPEVVCNIGMLYLQVDCDQVNCSCCSNCYDRVL